MPAAAPAEGLGAALVVVVLLVTVAAVSFDLCVLRLPAVAAVDRIAQGSSDGPGVRVDMRCRRGPTWGCCA